MFCGIGQSNCSVPTLSGISYLRDGRRPVKAIKRTKKYVREAYIKSALTFLWQQVSVKHVKNLIICTV